MSELAFLAPEAVEPADGFLPLARSSMERRLREVGAEFAERDGWLVAVHVPGEETRGLAIRDRTHFVAVREGSEGVEIRFGDGVRGQRPPTGDVVTTRYRYGGGSAGEVDPATLVDVSAGCAALEIDGPGAMTVLRRLTELDLEDVPAVGALAHVRAWVLHLAEERYLLVFEQEYGHYLWEVVVDAAEPLGGGPVGTP